MRSPPCAKISISTVLQEVSNFEELKLPRNFSTFGVSEIRNLTRQEMRPFGECHVPDIIFGCAFRLFISECSIQQCVKIYTELTSFFQCHRVYSVQNLALRHISLKIHINRLHYGTFDSRNA